MANEELVEELADSKPQKKAAKHDSGAADLEKVTDYAEEKEVISSNIAGAMNILDARRNEDNAARLAKERELAKVAIKKEDVELIVKEMEIPRQKAERTLREHHGNVVEALLTLINS